MRGFWSLLFPLLAQDMDFQNTGCLFFMDSISHSSPWEKRITVTTAPSRGTFKSQRALLTFFSIREPKESFKQAAVCSRGNNYAVERICKDICLGGVCVYICVFSGWKPHPGILSKKKWNHGRKGMETTYGIGKQPETYLKRKKKNSPLRNAKILPSVLGRNLSRNQICRKQLVKPAAQNFSRTEDAVPSNFWQLATRFGDLSSSDKPLTGRDVCSVTGRGGFICCCCFLYICEKFSTLLQNHTTWSEGFWRPNRAFGGRI